jgi:hypothetical protein
METTMAKIPVRYVGLKLHESDHLYGSGVKFTRGKVSQVPDWAAASLLRHPEYEDARPKDERGLPIIARRELDRADLEMEMRELEALEAHVNLETMTRDQMASYAMRTYGVRVDPSTLKADVTSSVRTLMQQRGAR